MKKCRGRCKQIRAHSEYGENRHGNPLNKCKECIRIERKEYRMWVLYPRMKEEKAMRDQQQQRDRMALPVYQRPVRPCAIFPGYLFAGDVA